MVEESKNEKMMVRGKAIASMPKFVNKNFGKEGYQKWLDAISVEAHSVYVLPIDLNEWYPLQDSLIKPCANVAQLFYSWDLKKASWDLGRFSADFGINSMYKLAIKMGSASFFLNKASEFMSSYYKPATISVGEIKDNYAELHITEFPEIDKTIEYRISGWTQRAMEINGCKNVNVEITQSLIDFKPFTEFVITWN
jgi:hypothetical protein